MFTPGRSLLLAVLTPFVFAGYLFAQRYPERDHTVFHRTPPAQTKHQIPQGVSPKTHSATSSAANNGAHSGSSANAESGPYSGPSANAKSGTVTPPDTNEHPPQ